MSIPRRIGTTIIGLILAICVGLLIPPGQRQVGVYLENPFLGDYEALSGAVGVINTVAGRNVFYVATSTTSDMVPVINVDALPRPVIARYKPNFPLYGLAVVETTRGLQPISYREMVLTHELLHVLGLAHSTATRSIMFWQAIPGQVLVEDDAKRIKEAARTMNPLLVPVVCKK